MTHKQLDVKQIADKCGLGYLVDENDEFFAGDKLAEFAKEIAAKEREAWRGALVPIFCERMGVEQVLEGVQHVIQWRCKK